MMNDKKLAFHAPVSQVMTRNVISIPLEASIEQVARLFLDRNISGAPVVDPDGRPIGVITKTDLLRASHDDGRKAKNPEIREGRQDGEGHQDHQGHDAREDDKTRRADHGARVRSAKSIESIMTPLTFSLPETAPLSQAAALMAYEGFHRLTIVDSLGAVVGVVSALDILRWMARYDGYLIPDLAQTWRTAS